MLWKILPWLYTVIFIDIRPLTHYPTAGMQLSIIIVNYNVKHFLEQCLYSLQKACQGISAEVWVVDNASTDDSLAYLKPLFAWVNWVEAGANLGFSRANNLALEHCTGKWVLFLNPDTLVPEDCLQQCLAFAEEHPKLGALGIKMVDGSGRFLPESKRAFPGPLTSFYKLTGLSALFPQSPTLARYHLGHLSPHQNWTVDVLAGAFMWVRRQVLLQVGSFDEQFFMYGEDIDLSYRIQAAGWQNWYFANSAIVHFKGESTKKGSLNYVRMFYQAMHLFVGKHYRGGKAVVFRLFIKLAIMLRALASATSRIVKKWALPLLDAALTILIMLGIYTLWYQYVRPD
ncbi:MAG TPA: glycosyltransferase family 2 protein, partial [Phnomibacter sp.]|nr:glycosyltransferase family 2 protein [Phnomibacter sp.]